MATNVLPDQATLRERLDYDRESGALIWLPRPRTDFILEWHQRRWNTMFAGKRAGSIGTVGKTGRRYWVLSFFGRNDLQHRLIFVWVTGTCPALVDHEDTNGLNNAWHNLREATKPQNAWNSRGHAIRKQPFKGIQPNGHGWSAKIMVNGTSHHLGTFATQEAAHEAYYAAAHRLHGQFANLGD